PLPVTEGWDPKSKAVPLRFSLPLSKLQPGKYDCQVTVLDPTTQKANFWSTPVTLVQFGRFSPNERTDRLTAGNSRTAFAGSIVRPGRIFLSKPSCTGGEDRRRYQ